MRDEGLLLPTEYQKQRRELAKDRRAAFAKPPIAPNQVWQLDFSEFETTQGRIWRIAGCRDWYSKYEHPFHISPTGNQHDAIAAVEAALAEYEAIFGHSLRDLCQVDEETGDLLPVVTILTDNGGPFRSPVLPDLHRLPPRAASRAYEEELTRSERITRTRIRHVEVRTALPR